MKFKDVLAGNLCSGCGLCASLLGKERAEMALQAPGYLRPQVSGALTEKEERLIADVCPGSKVTMPASASAGGSDWGPVAAVLTGHAMDERLRHQASSGGAISAILQHLLAQSDGPAYVLHIGADGQVPWLNAAGESRTDAEIAERAGSRYAPSAPLASLVERLSRQDRFVVVGKPCDIAALRAYARHDPRVDQCVIAMIAFMCGGIPSEVGIRELLARMGAPADDVRQFRYRGEGWPGHAKALLASGDERRISYAKSWGEVLSRHQQLRCKICADGAGASADIVCADAWHGDEKGYPLFDEQDGRSLILVRNEKGRRIVEGAVAAGRLQIALASERDVGHMQPFQARRTRLTLSRLLAMRLTGKAAPAYPGFELWRRAAQAGLRANVKSFLGALLRSLRGRL